MSKTDDELYQKITDICAENGGVTKPMVDKLYALIAQREQEISISDYINSLPHYWYQGDFGMEYDHVADLWVAGYGTVSVSNEYSCTTGRTPLEAVKRLYEWLVKEGKITDQLQSNQQGEK